MLRRSLQERIEFCSLISDRVLDASLMRSGEREPAAALPPEARKNVVGDGTHSTIGASTSAFIASSLVRAAACFSGVSPATAGSLVPFLYTRDAKHFTSPVRGLRPRTTKGIRKPSLGPDGLQISNPSKPFTVSVTYVYDDATCAAADKRCTHNVKTLSRIPKSGSGLETLVTRMTYESAFNKVATLTDPKGFITYYFYTAQGDPFTVARPANSDGIRAYTAYGYTGYIVTGLPTFYLPTSTTFNTIDSVNVTACPPASRMRRTT